ncbi:putative nucleotidyltransferase [compost metagenome]
MEFGPLRTIIKEQEIQEAIAELMERKQVSDEKQLVPPVTILNNWLADQLKWCKQEVSSLPADRNDTAELDEVFRRHIL